MNERQPCPKCKNIMYFIWPSPQKDPQVEAIVGRFQECPVCHIQLNVVQQQQYSITRVGNVLFVDQHKYSGVREWLTAIGLIPVTE